MRTTRRVLTAFILWTFAMALPLRPIVVIVHNVLTHASLHHETCHKSSHHPDHAKPVLAKHFHTLKRIAKGTCRSNYLPSPAQIVFLFRDRESGPRLLPTLPGISPKTSRPLRI